MVRLFFLLILFFLPGSEALSTTYHFEHISLKQGLSQTVVNAIAQDSIGYLWLGTQEGLNCYDGNTFRVFRKNPRRSHWISDNWINHLIFDGRHGLWLATRNGGLNFFDLKEYRFTVYQHQEGNSQTVSCNNISVLLLDKQKRLWIGTHGGALDMLELPTGRFRHFRLKENPTAPLYVTAITQDSSGTIWLGANNSIYRVDEAGGFIVPPHIQAPSDTTFRNLNIFYLATDSLNRIWIESHNGLFLLNPTEQRIETIRITSATGRDIASRAITAIYMEENGTIWLGTPRGEIFRLDSVQVSPTGTFRARVHQVIPRNKFNEPTHINWIRCIFADRSGNLWFGTFGQGLIKAIPVAMDYCILRSHPGDSTGLSHNFVRSIYQDSRNCLWIGTIGGGLNCYNRQTGRVTHYTHTGLRHNEIISNYVFQVVEDRHGNLYIATDYGIDYLDIKTGQFHHLFEDPAIRRHFSTTITRALALDGHGFLWIGSQEGLRILNTHIGEVALLTGASPLVSRLNRMNIWQIFPDSRGRFWILSQEEGVFYFTPDYRKGKFPTADSVRSLFEQFPELQNSPALLIFCIQETRDGTMFIGTNDGLIEYHPRSEKLHFYHEGKGLTNSTINGILEDANGDIWLSTNDGIFRFRKDRPDPVGNIFQQFALLDGYLDTEYNAGAYLKDHQGRLYFGSVEGLICFKPSPSTITTQPPTICLTGITVMGKPVAPFTQLPYLRHLKIPYQQNVISFEFQSLDFMNPDKNIYSYKLEGFDREWTSSTGRNFVNYTNLNPGDYVFRVRGCNSLGIWNMEGTSIRLTIVPPFWMTWWFKLLALVAFLFILYMAHKMRLKQLLELERLRIRIASNLHDDVGASLSRISMYADLIRNGIDRENVNRYLERIASLSREVTTTMSEIVWSVDARNDRFQNLIDRMNDFASGMLADRQIDFQLKVRGIDLNRRIPVDIRQNLYLIFKEALTNAVRHSGASQITVHLFQQNGQLVLSIRDNGKGYTPGRRSGHGLKNMQMRARAIQASIEFLNGDGFEVVVKRPAI